MPAVLLGAMTVLAPACREPAAEHPAAVTPASPAAADELPRDAWRADLEELVRTIEEVHPQPYHSRDRSDVHAEIARMLARGAGMSRVDFYRDVARFLATLQEGHTFVWPPADELLARVQSEPLAFPVTVAVASDGSLVVVAADPNGALAVGEHLVRVDGRDVAELVARWRTETSGEATEQRDGLIARQITERLWIDGIRAPFEIEVRDTKGATRLITLAGLTQAQLRARPEAAGASTRPWDMRIDDDAIAVLELRSMSATS